MALAGDVGQPLGSIVYPSRGVEDLANAWEVAAEAEAPGAAMPDFQLVDQNPASSTHGSGVSPRDYLQQVSGWYFGHGT